jgi:hypothetical protein
MTCTILITTSEGQEQAGTIELRHKTLMTKPAPGYELMFSRIMATPYEQGDELFTAQSNPVQWFRSLPSQYSGSYMRARIEP